MTEHRPLPLTQEDFAAMRKNVIARIEKQRKARTIGAAVGLAFAMLALVFVLLPQKTSEHAAARVARTSVRAPLVVAAIPPQPKARTEVRATRDTQKASVAPLRKRRLIKNQHHESIAQTASAEPMTIELHTSDPNIRIIWIARQENATP
jgi:hypothetical protein